MKDNVLTDICQVNQDLLNSVLLESAALIAGSVHDFDIQLSDSDNAQIAKIRLRYEQGATGKLPKSLLLKMVAGNSSVTEPSEVNYYARDYISLANPPIPTCYHARYSDNPRRYHILMDDLSASHRNNWRIKPTLAYGCAVAQALAAMHAHWWGVEKLHSIDGIIPSQIEIERYVDRAQAGLLPMLENVKAEIDGSWKHALTDIFKYHPAKMVERAKNNSGFTLIHGDVNPGNILSPLDGDGKTYLIDRQPFDWSLTTWLGVSDIAYMMVHWWETDLRRQLEISILREYYESLVRNGVSGYEWEQLLNDYKLTAVQSIYVATAWCVSDKDRSKMKWVWFPQLQKSMTAFFDLRCSDLWTE